MATRERTVRIGGVTSQSTHRPASPGVKRGAVEKRTAAPAPSALAPAAVVEPPKKKEPLHPPKPAVYLSNLPRDIPQATIFDAIAQEAGIEPVSVDVVKMGMPGKMRSSGLAAVMFANEEQANEAMAKLNGKMLLGRAIICRRDKFVEDQPGQTEVAGAAPAGTGTR